MSSGGYKIRNKAGIHFVTLTVVEWVDVFTRTVYKDILLDSIRHCQVNRDLLLHAWCLMTNHIHMILSARNNDTSEILRDLKKYTSKKIISSIENNQHESRRDWMLKIFKEQGEINSRNTNYQFWRQNNQSKELFCPRFIGQKINYTHNNCLEKVLWISRHYNIIVREIIFFKENGVT